MGPNILQLLDSDARAADVGRVARQYPGGSSLAGGTIPATPATRQLTHPLCNQPRSHAKLTCAFKADGCTRYQSNLVVYRGHGVGPAEPLGVNTLNHPRVPRQTDLPSSSRWDTSSLFISHDPIPCAIPVRNTDPSFDELVKSGVSTPLGLH
jgi:hypothetical protein